MQTFYVCRDCKYYGNGLTSGEGPCPKCKSKDIIVQKTEVYLCCGKCQRCKPWLYNGQLVHMEFTNSELRRRSFTYDSELKWRV